MTLPPAKHLWPFALVAASLVLLCACGRKKPASDTDNIFGPDNREETQDVAPYRAIGRLDSGCTATLVAKNLILTAAHCVIDKDTGTVKPQVRYFRPNLRNGKSAKPSWVNFLWIASKDPENDRINDWAFLRLEDNLGDEFGTLPILALDVSKQLPFTVSLVGYSSDKGNGDTQNIHRGCYIHKVVDGRYYHDCDATSGISGAPLLTTVNGNHYIIGMAVSEYRQGANGSVTRDQYSEDYTNVAIPTSTFHETSTTLIGSVEGGTSLPHFTNLTQMVNPNSKDQSGSKPGTDDPKPGDQTPKPGDQNPKPGDQQPNPGDQSPRDQEPNPGDDDQPGVGDANYATCAVISQRGPAIAQKVQRLAGTIRWFRDLSNRIGYRDVLVQTPRILGDLQYFDRTIAQIVNRGYSDATYVEPLATSYSRLAADAEYYQGLDSGSVPSPFVSDFEQARYDIQRMIADLGALIAQ